MRTFQRLAILAVVGLLVVDAVSYFSPATWGVVARWLDVGEPPRQVDYVMSLPGDENFRPFVAAALVTKGFAKKSLVVQNPPSPEQLDGFSMPTAEVIRRVYEHAGVPKEHVILLSGESLTTAQDIAVLKGFLDENQTATVAVVTSNYHTRRARWTLHDQLGDAADRVMMVSAPNADFELDRWWESEDGFVLVSTEYIKLGAYWVLYGSARWWAAGVGLAVVGWGIWRRKGARCQVSGVRKDNETGTRSPAGGSG